MTAPMGRPKKPENADLPPNMARRRYPSGAVAYYYTGAGKKEPLGSNLNAARTAWARRENAAGIAGTFAAVVDDWKPLELKKRGPKTQEQYEKYLDSLLPAFGHIPVDQIGTVHCQQYLELRSAKVKGNREISLLSTIFNWARRTGRTMAPNPVPGIERNFEPPRLVYVSDMELVRAKEHPKAPAWYREAIDLLLHAGQRPGDTLAMMWPHVVDGCLEVTQAKTKAKLRIEVEGELAVVLDQIRARPRKVRSLYIIADDRGQRVTVDQLQKVHVICRADMTWQVRDVRKKTGTDSATLKHAQSLLGHRRETTTATFYRQMKGDKVKPLR